MIMRMERKFLFLLLPLSLIALALILVSSLAYSSPISDSNINTNNVETRFTFDAPEFHEFEEYDIVKIKGCSLTTNIGEPKLPVKTKILFIPESSTIVDIVVLTEKEEIEGNYTIYPTQPPRTITNANATATNASFVVNHTVYNSSSPYPENIVEYSEGCMGTRKIVVISVYPIQYIPKEGKIVFYRNISISLKIKCSEISPSPLIERGGKTEFFGTLSQHSTSENNLCVLNAGDAKLEYVIITSYWLESSFNVLADWKTKKGVPAAVFTTTFINDSYEGVDLQAKIRNFIRDKAENNGTIYVLLGGDTEIIHERKAYGDVGGTAGDIPADLYYADLDGSWDDDNDRIYGEVADNIDLYPDVFVGRAPVTTAGEAINFVNKMIEYEKAPVGDVTDILFFASKLDVQTNGGDMKEIIAELIPPEYNLTKRYQMSPYDNINRTLAIEALNNNPHIVNHVGHGGTNALYVYTDPDESVGSTDASDLNNSFPFLIYSIACLSNSFENSEDAISEHFMNNTHGGAFAYIGNSREGWYEQGRPGEGPSDMYDVAFFNILFHTDVYRLGEAFAYSKILFVPDSQEDGNGMRWVQYSLNLLGDPELPIWTEEPKELNVSYDCDYDHDGTGKRRIDIHVQEESGGVFEPLKDALVCLQGENTYVYGHTNSDGEIILETPLEEDLNLTVTKHNFLPNETIIAGLKHDINVTTDYAGAVNGIRIENVATGENVSEGKNLTIGETYNISYKIVNEGDFNESSISVTVKVGNTTTGWNETIGTSEHNYSLHIGDSGTYLVAWNITTAGLAEGIYNITVNASITSEDARLEDNERTRKVVLEMLLGKPNITQWYPLEAIVNNTADESRTFKVAANQTVNVTWYINDSVVDTNTSVPAEVNATYTNTSAAVGVWNVSAIAVNVNNNSDMHTWIWNVSSAPDITAPIITNVTALNITANSVTITWDTNEGSNSLVKYGTAPGNYTEQTYNETETDVIFHTVTLTGLDANDTYHYVVNSTDGSGNANESEEHNFTTPGLESSSPSPCFIATAAYGTPLHEDIDVLRDFRDEYLMSNPLGRGFVKLYYKTSPPIATVISEHDGLRAMVREGMVKPLVYIVQIMN